MELIREINYKERDWRRDLGMIAVSLGLLLVCIDIWSQEFLAATLLHLLVAIVLTFTLHELTHGLFFRIWGAKVKFGAGMTKFGPVFYASSPGTLLPRNKMLAIAAAPQILTVLYFLLSYLPFVEPVRIVLILTGMLNLSGGASDFWTIVQMLKYPKKLQVEDQPMGLKFYLPTEGGSSEGTEFVT